VTLHCEIPSITDPDDEKAASTESIPCGIGFDKDIEKPYRLAPTAFWFAKALTPHPDRPDFMPGSTHSWISELRRTGPSLSGGSLRVLVVGSRPSESAARDRITGICGVFPPAERFDEWGEFIARGLNERFRISWPYRQQDDGFDPVRYQLYNIWLSATLQPLERLQAGLVEALEKFLSHQFENRPQITGLTAHLRRALQQQEKILADPRYANEYSRADMLAHGRWYTLAIDAPLGAITQSLTQSGVEVHAAELGSAMIISSRSLPIAYLLIAQEWITSMYQSFRELESSILSRELANADMIGAFSHEVGKLGTGLLQKWIRPLSDIFGGDLGPQDRTYGWSEPPFSISIPPAEREFVSQWRIATVPPLFENMAFMLAVWSGSRNLPVTFGLGSVQKLALESLVAELIPKARAVAAARWMANAGAPATLEQAKHLTQKFYEHLGVNIAQFRRKALERCPLTVLLTEPARNPAASATVRRCSSLFIRLLMALFTNAAYHADPKFPIEVSLRTENERLKVRIVDQPREGSSGATEEESEFVFTTRAVAEHCLAYLEGELTMFPAASRRTPTSTVCETAFHVPWVKALEGSTVQWLFLD
jgi:hypothetical protein